MEGSGKTARPLLRPFFLPDQFHLWSGERNGAYRKREDDEYRPCRTLRDLLVKLEIDPTSVAVERNLEIAPKTMYESLRLCDGDRIEIVHFVGGG